MRPAAMALVAMLAACGVPEDHFPVSVGGGGTLAASPGCTRAPSPALRFVTAERYVAIAPGAFRMTCPDRVIVIDVREPARIVISPVPTAHANANLVYSIDVLDAAGTPLDIGEDASITWSFGGALTSRNYPGCGDIIPICLPYNDGFAAAMSPGVGTIDASFHGLHASATTTITP